MSCSLSVDSAFVPRAVTVMSFIASFAWSGALLAQGATAAAESLFRDGRELMEKGDVVRACPKLAESQRLDPSSGTLLNLALCHEKQGLLATAWAEYLAAVSLARSQGREGVLTAAKRGAAELEGRVSYVTLAISHRPSGLTVRLDQVELASQALGSKIAVDPGTRKITVAAPGHEPLELSIEVGSDGENQTVTVPELRRTPAASEHPPPPPAELPKKSPAAPPTQSTSALPYVVGGAGVVALGVGVTFVLLARSAYSDAEDQCPTHTGCSQSAMSLRERASTRATIGAVGVGAGIVGVGAGVALLAFGQRGRSREKARPFGVGVAAFSAGGGVKLTGAF